MTSETNALTFVTSSAYDAMSRLTQVTQPDPDGSGSLSSPAHSMTYDTLGRMLTQTDPLNNVTTLAYDNRSRLITQTDPDPDGTSSLTSPVT